MEPPKLLTAADVAHRLNIARWRAWELVREGVLPAVRIGRNIRVNPEVLEAFIEAGGRGLDDGDG